MKGSSDFCEKTERETVVEGGGGDHCLQKPVAIRYLDSSFGHKFRSKWQELIGRS